jgi:hypothetical protein
MQYGIATADIYNFDETGYAMGLTATAKVVTRSDLYGKRQVVQPGNREWVTSIECISSTGYALPPCIIFKGKVHIQGWYEDPNIPHDWRFEISKNGWTNDEIGLRWLQKLFIPATASRTVGKYRLLILDGHGSHFTPEFDKIYSENNIIPICMLPHSSNNLQPLDVVIFSPLKKAYGSLVQNKMRGGINHIDKLDFIKIYPEARNIAFTTDNVLSAFRATGLIPFNPEEVLGRFTMQLKTPTPPGSRSTDSAPKTPYNIKQLKKQTTTIEKLLRACTQSPSSPTKTALNQLVKGCEMVYNNGAFLAQENQYLRATINELQQKKKRSKRQITHTEGFSVQEAREYIQHENEVKEAQDTILVDQELSPIRQRVRAPPRCSDCHILGHTRRQCPNQCPN